MTPPLRIGISSCLLGQKVRFDGGHKRDAFLVDTFGRYVEWVSVCPEVEIGMGTPREAVRLEKAESGPFPILMVAPKSGTDWTPRMTAFARRRVEELAAQLENRGVRLHQGRLWQRQGQQRHRAVVPGEASAA